MLGGESELMVRTYGFPGGLTRPTGDLDSLLPTRDVHVEACRPRVCPQRVASIGARDQAPAPPSHRGRRTPRTRVARRSWTPGIGRCENPSMDERGTGAPHERLIDPYGAPRGAEPGPPADGDGGAYGHAGDAGAGDPRHAGNGGGHPGDALEGEGERFVS